MGNLACTCNTTVYLRAFFIRDLPLFFLQQPLAVERVLPGSTDGANDSSRCTPPLMNKPPPAVSARKHPSLARLHSAHVLQNVLRKRSFKGFHSSLRKNALTTTVQGHLVGTGGQLHKSVGKQAKLIKKVAFECFEFKIKLHDGAVCNVLNGSRIPSLSTALELGRNLDVLVDNCLNGPF